MKRTVWYVLTPSGEAGPYYVQQAAKDAAKRFGWIVVSRREELAHKEEEHRKWEGE